MKLSFGATLPDGVTTGATAQAVVIISDDDTAGVTVAPTELTVTEGGQETYAVALDSQPEGNVQVTVNDPTDNTDVTAEPASLTFTPTDWNTGQTVTVSAAQDGDDQDESATIKHTVSGYGTVTSAADVAVKVQDDAPQTVTVSFEQAAYTMAEGGTKLIKVLLDADPERAVTVPLTHSGEGGAGPTDYEGVPANIVFNSGDTEKTFTITATQDTEDDDGESVKLGFGTLPEDVTAGTPASATVSIDDDDDPEVTVSFEQETYSVNEGNDVTVAVILSADPERTVQLTLTKADQGGATSADYSNVPANVTFNAGDTRKTFAFTATQDTDNDDGESVKLGFGTPLPDGVSAGPVSETTVSITDDDVPSVTVSFGAASYTVAESDDPDTPSAKENEVAVTIRLSADPERTVTIPVTSTGQDGATAADYSVPASVVFNAGDTQQSFTFSATHDTVDDDGENVKLSWGTPLPAGVSAGPTSETTVSITDDDDPRVTVSFGQASYTVAESDDASTTNVTENEVEVTVVLSADPERTVEIPISVTDVDGASSADYSGIPDKVVFNSGDTRRSFVFNAAHDTMDDDGERVRLTFGTLPPRVNSTSPSQAVVSITDDDTAGVSISETSLELEEGDSDTYTVVLDTEPAGNVTVTLGGVDDTDLTLNKSSLTFTAGNWDTAQTVRVTAEQDADAVDEEPVNITHTVSSTADTQYDGISAGSVAVTVTDDESPDPELTLTMEPPAHGDTDVDGKVNLGDTLRYTAVATNSGNVPLENVNVKDALINTSGTDCASLPIGATCTSTVTYTIVQADVDRGSVSNTATATADGVADKTVTRQTAVDQVEGLALEKTTTADGFAGTGVSIPYSYKATNTGTVSLPGTLEIDDDKIAAGNITCPAVPGGGLAPGAFLTCTGSYATVQADVDAGKVTNLATASLGDATSGSDSVTVNWQAPRAISPNSPSVPERMTRTRGASPSR